MNDRELLTFRSRLVRDLAWAITVPSLIQPVFPPGRPASGDLRPNPARPVTDGSTDGAIPVVSDPTHWLSDTVIEASWRRVYPRLRELDGDDAPLRRFLAGTERLRHGLRFERLLAYWFDLDPEISVVTADRQVFTDGRTIGQIDFILNWAGKITQLEVAVKYYLQFGSATTLDGYLGTDLRDRLDIKLAHMLFHQRTIRLPKQPEDPAEFSNAASVVSIRGRLYRRFIPGDAGELPKFWWIDARDLRDPAARHGVAELCRRWWWTRGERGHWFSPLSGDDARWRTWDELLPKILAGADPAAPRCEMVIAAAGVNADQSTEREGEVCRGFLVLGLLSGTGKR